MTGDYWDVDFSQSELTLPKAELEAHYKDDFEQVNLFSGGLDSLIGAIKFLEDNPNKKLITVSHYDSQMKGPKTDQADLITDLKAVYGDRITPIPSIKVELNKTGLKETTFRSRSILFMGMAGIIANALKLDINIPENGSVSLNYPLSPSRRSACSTRTTHPKVLDGINDIWRQLGINEQLSNPFEFSTKGEMVNMLISNEANKQMYLRSNSCGKRRHDERRKCNPDAKHCGVCMPCIYRRAALMKIDIDNDTDYGDRIKDLNFATKKGQDIAACLSFLKKTLSKQDIRNELIVSGIQDQSKLDEYVNLIERTRIELKQLFLKKGSTDVKNRAGI